MTIAALEADACRELATRPLARLGLRWAAPELVDRIVAASGQRANLVAILCQECLDRADAAQRVIEASHVEAALASTAVQEALAGWARLTPDERACRIDRCLVYLVALRDSVRLADLLATFADACVVEDVERVRLAFARLQLAFVLARHGDAYSYAVPLLHAQCTPAEAQLLLAQELAALRATPHPSTTS